MYTRTMSNAYNVQTSYNGAELKSFNVQNSSVQNFSFLLLLLFIHSKTLDKYTKVF